MASFDLNRWRDGVQQQVDQFARDPKGFLRRAGVSSMYAALLTGTMLPVVAAYIQDPQNVMSVLFGVFGGIGSKLVANLAQKVHDKENPHRILAQEAQQLDFAPIYESIAKQTEVFATAQQALKQAGKTEALEQLLNELKQLNKTSLLERKSSSIQQTGGINVALEDATISIDSIIEGDQVAGNYSVYHGPSISGPIKSSGNIYIGTNLRVTHNQSISSSSSNDQPEDDESQDFESTNNDSTKDPDQPH